MSSYILLRDKVESKSLSLEELQAKGLTSSDLIWVECQSWDWQRPQDIPELKVFLVDQPAPVSALEKNTAATKHKPESPIFRAEPEQAVLFEKQERLKVQKTILPESESNLEANKYTGLNSLTESSPGIESIPEKETVHSAIENKASSGLENYAPIPLNDQEIFNKRAYDTKSINDNAVSKPQDVTPHLQTNYSRSLDEIKELYVKNLLQKGRTRREKIWSPVMLKKAVVYIGFAVVGAMVVLATRNNSDKKNIAVDLPALAIVQAPKDTVVNPPEENITDFEQVSETDIQSTRDLVTPTPPGKIPDEQPARLAVEKKPIEEPVEKAGKEMVSEIPEQTEALIPKKITPAADISSQLSLRANEYITGSFGGIRDLQMTLQNDSKYTLDAVRVEINYLNLDHITVHKEQVVFRSVDPGKSETIAVKKTRRGVRIKYKIIKIESSDAGHTAGF